MPPKCWNLESGALLVGVLVACFDLTMAIVVSLYDISVHPTIKDLFSETTWHAIMVIALLFWVLDFPIIILTIVGICKKNTTLINIWKYWYCLLLLSLMPVAVIFLAIGLCIYLPYLSWYVVYATLQKMQHGLSTPPNIQDNTVGSAPSAPGNMSYFTPNNSMMATTAMPMYHPASPYNPHVPLPSIVSMPVPFIVHH